MPARRCRSGASSAPFVAALLACVAFAAPAAAAPPRPLQAGAPVVAVFEIQARGVTLSPATLAKLSEMLRTRLAGSGTFQIVPQASVRRVQRKKTALHHGCHDRACQIAIGRELAAKKILATKIIALGKLCVVTAVLFDLRRAASEGGGRAEAACSVDALTRAVRTVAAQLEAAQPKRSRSPTPTAPSGPRSSTGLELRTKGGASFAVLLRTAGGKRRACTAVTKGKPCRLAALTPGSARLRVSSGGRRPLTRTLALGEVGAEPRLWVYELSRGSSTGAIILWVAGSVVAATGIALLAGGLAGESGGLAIAGGITLLAGGGLVGLGFLPDGIIKAKREDYAVRKSSARRRLRLGAALHGRF